MQINQRSLKRLIDVLGSFLGLIVLSPIFIIIAIMIKITSEGSVLFKQERIGLAGKTFRIFKFRTMVPNAEHIGDGVFIANEQDERITMVGKILRRTSLDELPQLFNVLRGEMSLVGPRPPVTYYPYDGYENYPHWAKKRFEMRPGITGLVQIKMRATVPWNDRIKVDVEYISTFSLWKDMIILVKTFAKVLNMSDIYVGSLAALDVDTSQIPEQRAINKE